jgi:hypothetical protein
MQQESLQLDHKNETNEVFNFKNISVRLIYGTRTIDKIDHLFFFTLNEKHSNLTPLFRRYKAG